MGERVDQGNESSCDGERTQHVDAPLVDFGTTLTQHNGRDDYRGNANGYIHEHDPGPAVRSPPRMAPTANPAEASAPTRPNALLRGAPSAKVVVISERAVGATR